MQLQLRIAAGEALPFTQKDVAWRGWAMECRICAEDPENQFFPSPGRIGQLREPSGPGVRLDSGVYPGWTVPLEYDPLLAKLVTWAPDRNTAIERLQRALSEYAIAGIQTNIAFFREILDDAEFLAGNLSTEFVADFMARRKPRVHPTAELERGRRAGCAGALPECARARHGRIESGRQPLVDGRARPALPMKWQVAVDGRTIEIDSEQLASVKQVEPGVYSVLLDGASYEIRLIETSQGLSAEVAGRRFSVEVRDPRDTSRGSRASVGSGRQNVTAPMPGKVVRVLVNVGDAVEVGQGLVVVEAMKMQNEMKASRPGRVMEIRASAGETVGAGETLLILE